MRVFVVFPPFFHRAFMRVWIGYAPSKGLFFRAFDAGAGAGVSIASMPVFARFACAVEIQLKLYGFCAFQAKNFNL